MPSILDYLDHPEFLQSVIGGNTADSFGPQAQQPPQPPMPPPDIMARSPPQFGPGAAVDGGKGPADSFADRFPPSSEPISMPQPTGQKYEGGIFGGMGFKPLGWDEQPPAPPPRKSPAYDEPGTALAFAGAPQTRNGYTYEDPPGLNLRNGPMAATSDPEGFARSKHAQAFPPEQPAIKPVNEISVNRTPRNGMSLDDMAVDSSARPVDIRSPVQRGEPDPRIQRARAFGNFMASLGKGLTAVGAQKPGTSGAAAFAGGAGGALTGGVENEKHNLDRDEKGLDRAERGRERDQTFDYQNRTLRANTDYHDKLVEQHSLDRKDRTEQHGLDRTDRTEQHIADREARANQERYTPVGQDADGRIIYSDRNHPGREILGDNKAVSRTGAGNQGGNTERLARIIQAEHGKDSDGNYKITMEDAVRRAQSHPTDAADVSRRERMARQDLDAQEKNFRRGDTRKTLEDFRRALGLPPAPGTPVPLPPNTRRGVDPDSVNLPPNMPPSRLPPPALPGQGMALPGAPAGGPSSNDARSSPIGDPTIRRSPLGSPPPTSTPSPAPPFNPGPLPPAGPQPNGQPGYATNPALSRPPLPGPPSPTVGAGAPAQAPARPVPMSAAPPRPPTVPPGSQYSPSRNAWRAPDGTIIPGQPPQ